MVISLSMIGLNKGVHFGKTGTCQLVLSTVKMHVKSKSWALDGGRFTVLGGN